MLSGSPSSGPAARCARAVGLSLGLAILGTAAQAITGVCPDGSVFVVSHAEDIPCRNAKEVEPHEVPPLRPEYLPRPYTWEVYERQERPTNPYNLVDPAEQVRALRDAAAGDGSRDGASAPERDHARATASEEGYRAAGFGFSDAELQALYRIVALSQQRAPASFVQETADGRAVLRIAFAHARSFEARLPEANGPVLLFSAVAEAQATLGDQFTFVQDHLAFHPEVGDQRQMGVLQGALGPLEPGAVVLGYVVLPAAMDLGRAMDVYWNDRRIRVSFRPEASELSAGP